MDKTPFAGLTRLTPSDPLSEDGFSFQQENPTILDELLRLAVQLHKHDAHAALANPTADPTVVVNSAGGTIPADASITVGYTLLDENGGETTLNVLPVLVTTQGGIETPDAGPDLTHDIVAGTLLAGSYAYAVSVTDGLGGETLLGPSSDVLVPTGSATNRINVAGLTQIVNDAGGTGWRLWRSINGDAWGLLATGASATDAFMDDGSTPCDCGQHPPTSGSGSTNATNQLQVTVPSDAINDTATQFRVYASLDGEFGSPALLGTYPVADLGAVKTYNSLTTLADGSPPDVSRAFPGADPIDYLTDVINRTFLPPVADAASLPSGDPDGAVRATLDTFELHIYDATGDTWTAIGGGGGGGGGDAHWKAPVVNAAALPDEASGSLDGDVRVTLDNYHVHVFDDNGAGVGFWTDQTLITRAVDEVSFTTASLADGATEQSEQQIGAVAILLYLWTDVPARVTIYAQESSATADAGRAITTPPSGPNHGVLLDVELDASIGNYLMLTPAVTAVNQEAADNGLWVRVTNQSGALDTVNVNIGRKLL
jgi:hypothetical protein